MKQYSFLKEALDQTHESVIHKNVVYHGSQTKMSIIKGGFTQDNKQRFGYNCVYVTPYKYCAAHFIFDGDILYNEVIKRNYDIDKEKIKKQFCCGEYQNAIWHYNGFLNKFFEKDLDNKSHLKLIQNTYPKHIDVWTNIKYQDNKAVQFKDFKCKFTGYIHYIDYDKYKDKSFYDNYRTQEFVIKGNVKPFKIDKITLEANIHYWNGER